MEIAKGKWIIDKNWKMKQVYIYKIIKIEKKNIKPKKNKQKKNVKRST
jgi:hypothetical protein